MFFKNLVWQEIGEGTHFFAQIWASANYHFKLPNQGPQKIENRQKGRTQFCVLRSQLAHGGGMRLVRAASLQLMGATAPS